MFQVGPLDAGTDSGFTFTAPNWPTEPRVKITRITAQQPSHPANSFYYPDKKQLPPIATFHFHKVRAASFCFISETLLNWNRLGVAYRDDILVS
jgi:hypothetical protein